MKNQSKKFKIPNSITYLNTSYMSAIPRDVEQIGKDQTTRKALPYTISSFDFFEPTKQLCKTFGKLIGTDDYKNIAIIPSASYGLENAAQNVKLKSCLLYTSPSPRD